MNIQETKKEFLKRNEEAGRIVPDCPGCAEVYQTGSFPLAPSHRPSPRCESGKRPHRTCDVCF